MTGPLYRTSVEASNVEIVDLNKKTGQPTHTHKGIALLTVEVIGYEKLFNSVL